MKVTLHFINQAHKNEVAFCDTSIPSFKPSSQEFNILNGTKDFRVNAWELPFNKFELPHFRVRQLL